MEIQKIEVGYLKTNCYLLSKNDEVLIIDPGDEAEKIISHINGKVVAILITHSHFDHVGAVDDLVNKYHVKVYDKSNLKEGKTSVGSFTFNTVYFPGHLDDLVSFYFEEENVLFVGDFIFKDSIGRVDLPGGNAKDMMQSIKKILNYNKNITLYPGHGPITHLDDERDNLRYLINPRSN